MSDTIFINFFFNWLESNSCNEFYLINKSGSFLIKKKNGSLAYFIVFTEDAKNEFLKLNQDAAQKTGNLLDKLSQGQAIPFFGLGKESWDFTHDCWGQYFFSSNTLSGRQNYYWTVINDGDI